MAGAERRKKRSIPREEVKTDRGEVDCVHSCLLGGSHSKKTLRDPSYKHMVTNTVQSAVKEVSISSKWWLREEYDGSSCTDCSTRVPT